MSASRPRPHRPTKPQLFLFDEADRAEELGRLDMLLAPSKRHPSSRPHVVRRFRRMILARRRRVTGATLPTY